MVINDDSAIDPPTSREKVLFPVLFAFKVYAPFIVPPKVNAPLPAATVVFAVNTIGVPASPRVMVVFVVFTVLARLTWLGAVATTPPVKVVVSPEASPNVT